MSVVNAFVFLLVETAGRDEITLIEGSSLWLQKCFLRQRRQHVSRSPICTVLRVTENYDVDNKSIKAKSSLYLCQFDWVYNVITNVGC